MDPPTGIWASLWHFILFLPIFTGLLILGLFKGIIIAPVVCLIMTAGISVILLGTWPIHCYYTYYCIYSTKQFGPSLKLVLYFVVVPAILICWPPIGIASAILGGAAYGLLSPIFATFHAVKEEKSKKLYHCICDGIWSSLHRSFTIVRDFLDVSYYSYFSIMSDLRNQGPEDGKYYEIRLVYIPLAVFAGVLGAIIDLLVITVIVLCKSPYMLIKGWHRLFHDCIGREGPFLETICVPFAGLAILLWPLSVILAVIFSVIASIFLGAYAAVIVYQEQSLWLGLRYILASLSIYDDYSNDILGMPEGSCFPSPTYRVKSALQDAPLSKQGSSKNASCKSSANSPIVELNPLELADALFAECQRHGEVMASEGIITFKDVEDAKTKTDVGNVISIGLPAYCLFQALLRSAKANSTGILLTDGAGEINPSNRPKDKFFDWFLSPLLIIKEQIQADNLSEAEEEYLGKLILLSGDTMRLKNLRIYPAPESEIRQAELGAIARRLHGITKSISRFPTFKRRFDSSMSNILEELAKKGGYSRRSSSNGSERLSRSKSLVERVLSTISSRGIRADQDGSQTTPERDIEIGKTT